ncbi:MAG TPA: redoxin domain-containing protein [Terriglobales bacterium]|jgi:peroxiredoxin|nr:redoxin domain-containing protein [Terriglobales bacterium]
MAQLREFAQHSKDFDSAKIKVVAISVDPQDLGRQTWEKVAERKFSILSDPQASAARAYGVFEAGEGGKPSNQRMLVLVDEQGREVWQHPAGMLTVADVIKQVPQGQ